MVLLLCNNLNYLEVLSFLLDYLDLSKSEYCTLCYRCIIYQNTCDIVHCNSVAKMWNSTLSKSKPPLYSVCIHDLLMTWLITNITILSRCIHPNITYILCWAIILPSRSRHLSLPFTHVASWWWRRRLREGERHGQSQCAIENTKRRRVENTAEKSNNRHGEDES